MTEYNKVLMPVIRKVYPTLIAQQIIGVQPMSISTTETPIETGETYVDEATSYATEANTVEFYWVKPKMPSTNLFTFNSTSVKERLDSDTEIYEWACTTFGWPSDPSEPVAVWMRSNQKYYFKNAEDRLMFVMRWS